MGEISVKKVVDLPAARVWEVVADFGDISRMPTTAIANLAVSCSPSDA